MRMLKWISGRARHHSIKNTIIREKIVVHAIVQNMKDSRLRFGV